jgi:thiamine-monophosphate kinase
VSARTLAQVGELGFLRRLLPRLPRGRDILIPAGDDCALVRMGSRRLLLTTDALVANVHFRPGWMRPDQLGRKAYLVNASDVAAMGGRPRFALVSAGVPPGYPSRDLDRLHRGLMAAARETGALLVGGNLVRAEVLFVSLTLAADSPPRPLQRGGARPGDLLFVTGRLGEAALGLRLLLRDPRAGGAAVRRFREPIPRLKAGALLATERIASAAIDVSDGLLQDLRHLCRASNVGARVELASLPCPARVRRAGADGYTLALTGGEDYELLYAVPPRHLDRLRRLRPSMGCPTTRIGEVMPKTHGVRVVDARGASVALPAGGFDHFAGWRR